MTDSKLITEEIARRLDCPSNCFGRGRAWAGQCGHDEEAAARLRELEKERDEAIRLAGLKDIEPPGVIAILSAPLILKGREQKALDALVRNIQRLEEALDEARNMGLLCDYCGSLESANGVHKHYCPNKKKNQACQSGCCPSIAVLRGIRMGLQEAARRSEIAERDCFMKNKVPGGSITSAIRALDPEQIQKEAEQQ